VKIPSYGTGFYRKASDKNEEEIDRPDVTSGLCKLILSLFTIYYSLFTK